MKKKSSRHAEKLGVSSTEHTERLGDLCVEALLAKKAQRHYRDENFAAREGVAN